MPFVLKSMTPPMRGLPRAAIATLLCVLLGGCALLQTRWPEEGRGQFAEQFESEDARAHSMEARLLQLEARGANVHAAGDLDEGKLLLVRIKRQADAGLVLDAEDDMVRLEALLTRIDARLVRAGAGRTRLR